MTWIVTFVLAYIIALMIKFHLSFNHISSDSPQGDAVWTVFNYICSQSDMMIINWISKMLSLSENLCIPGNYMLFQEHIRIRKSYNI